MIAARRPLRSGNTMPFVALGPKYLAEHHQVYLDLLERAVRHPDTRSVALTGSYGSGKSSVLRALGRRYWNSRFPWRHRRTVIQLSLSTLDPELAPVVQAENPAEREMSNRIQKELVKQLLYQLPPRSTPHSRFPRASKPTWSTGALVAAATALIVGLGWGVATLAGWQATITGRLDEVGWTVAWFWSGLAGGSAIFALAAWRILAGRYAVKAGLKAGALTVSLEPTSSSYFDQYLDEIMYFFQVSKADVVLIEDVDRFDDAIVFDTLRALNTLVNGSGQVGRRIVFVYAIRDSVLGKIGAKKKNEQGGEQGAAGSGPEKLAMDRSNRAKYFDVIIPIVPFVTADNARDLMTQVMKPHVADTADEEGISPAQIRLAARHVADMRTLWSIRNEYEVHFDRLMTSARHVMPEINEDIVLSLVLLRATSPDTYERIRLATSPLDTLTKRWLALVDANLGAQTKKLTEVRTRLENGESHGVRATQAGQRLDSLRPELLAMATRPGAHRVEFSGPVSDSDLADLAGWQRIADGTPLTVTLWSRTSENVRIGPQMLARLIGMPMDPQAWQEADLEDLRREIERTEREISFLRHHTWKQLYARTDLTVQQDPDEEAELITEDATATEINFAGLVRAYAPTPLACDLVAHGHLPRHYARYASMFYGEVVGLNAAEYISRAIEPGVPILEYELDAQAIGQILSEQNADDDDADLFGDLSVYNLDIVAYLVEHRRGAAQRVAAHLARRWGDLERKFVDRFFQREDQETVGNLAALMAPTWDRAFLYTAVDAPVTPETRLGLVDAVLGTIGTDEREDLDQGVGIYFSEHYAELPSLIDPPDEARADTVMGIVAAAAGTIYDLTKLQPMARAAATQASIYPVTSTNLGALGGAGRVALDILRAETETKAVHDHALANLADYLDALRQLEPPGTPVLDPTEFANTLNDIAGTPQETLLDRFIEATSSGCRITDLNDAVPGTWPALVDARRADPTFGNVQRYLNEHGMDHALGSFLVEHPAITTPEEALQSERLAVATKILATRDRIPASETRVALAESIAPGIIPIGEIAPEDANLVGPLLNANLLSDEPETFDPDLLKDWGHFEAAVAASRQFGEFADPITMPPRHLAKTLKSKVIPSETRDALILKLASLLTGATAAEATAVARALAEGHEHLDMPRIKALQAAGLFDSSLTRLIATQGEVLSVADLRAILLAMEGANYVKLSMGGSGIVRFKVDPDHRFLLDRLAGVTHTGAKEVITKKYGKNLEASLKQAAP